MVQGHPQRSSPKLLAPQSDANWHRDEDPCALLVGLRGQETASCSVEKNPTKNIGTWSLVLSINRCNNTAWCHHHSSQDLAL